MLPFLAVPFALGRRRNQRAYRFGAALVLLVAFLPLPVSAQAVYDRGAALGLLLAAVVFELAGEPGASVVFGIAGAATLAVTSVTRYSARPV